MTGGSIAVIGFVVELASITTPLLRSVLLNMDKIRETDKAAQLSELDFDSIISHLLSHEVFR